MPRYPSDRKILLSKSKGPATRLTTIEAYFSIGPGILGKAFLSRQAEIFSYNLKWITFLHLL
jgi:hypothetical protein